MWLVLTFFYLFNVQTFKESVCIRVKTTFLNKVFVIFSLFIKCSIRRYMQKYSFLDGNFIPMVVISITSALVEYKT